MIEQHTEVYDIRGESSFKSMKNDIDDHAKRGWFVKCITKFDLDGYSERILVVYTRKISSDTQKEITRS